MDRALSATLRVQDCRLYTLESDPTFSNVLLAVYPGMASDTSRAPHDLSINMDFLHSSDVSLCRIQRRERRGR